MGLPNDIITQFVKITNDNKKEGQTKAYGTIVAQGEDRYVQLDGSSFLTPIESTVFLNDGDRVSVTIKNHNVTVDGNFSDVSASNDYVLSVDDDLSRLIVEMDDAMTDISEVLNNNEELIEKVDTIETKINDTSETLSTIENDIDDINDDMWSMNKSVSDNTSKIAKIETKLADSHNYIYHGTVTVDVASYTTVDLPGEIAYKKGTDYAVILHVKDYNFGDSWGTIVTQRMMIFVSSRTNISFRLRTLIVGLDTATGEQITTGTATINYTIIA